MRRRGKVKAHIVHVEDGHTTRPTDDLAIEEPLEIQLSAGGTHKTIAITMRTPGHDYELAAGFLYSEGVITHRRDVGHMIYCVDGRLERQEYNLLRVHLTLPTLPDLSSLDRHFFTTSACGVCGRTMLEELDERTLPPLPDGPHISADLIAELPERLRAAQSLFDATGGLHAAAIFNPQGTLLAVREDVGRHNALDKLIGWALLNDRLPLSDHIIVVSGRAGYELLHKCRVAGAPIFCAVSAPTSLAVELAGRFGVTLVAFLRGNRFNIYAGEKRIDLEATPTSSVALSAPHEVDS